MDSQSEVEHFFEKLSNWREESHKELSNILQFHNSSINEAFNHLVQEVSDLKTKLAVITRERNNLLGTVHNLSTDISAELAISQPMPEPEEIQAKDTQEVNIPKPEVEDNKGQNVEKSYIGFETGVPDDTLCNASADLDIVEHESDEIIDEVNEENHMRKDIIGEGKRKEILLDTTPNKSQQYESKSSYNTVQDDDHVCPECNIAFLTSQNLKIHLKNLHPKFYLINDREYIQQKGSRKLKREQCPYNSVRKMEHIKSVHENIRNHVCGECGYAASRKDTLRRHIEGVHKNIRNHVCGDCGYAAKQKGDLKKHIEQVHENIRNNVCGECGYAASRKDSLKKHIKAMHENEEN